MWLMDTKRIAIIIDTLNGGGAEKVCLSLFKGMLAKNIDVHMIVLKQKCDYEIPASNNIHFVFNDHKINLSNYFVQVKAAKNLVRVFEKLGSFDAYISNLDVTHAIVAKIKLPNCFYVVHNSIEKSLEMHRKYGIIKYWRKRRAINVLNGKRVITVSKGIKEEIVTGKIITPLDITTIYNPIDIASIKKNSMEVDADIPEHDYILFIGRIANQKRVDILIKAFQYVKSDLNLVVLTNNQKKLNKLIKQYNIQGDAKDRNNAHNKKIIGLNFKQNPYPLIKQAKALVLSSDFEGLGMVLIEALACGTPAVSTDCDHGPNEILLDDLARFLSPVGDPIKLAEKIDLAINYQLNKPKILEKVSVDKVVDEYLQLINSNE